MEQNAKHVPVLSSMLLGELFERLYAFSEGRSNISASLDLNLSEDEIILDHGNREILLPDGNVITRPASFDPELRVCYFIDNNSIYPLRVFDDNTNFYYHLVPTSYRPILRISATQMHKKPFLDYLNKMRLKGRILDAGTGLGYSAIIAGQTAREVITVEWDPNVIEMARFNPHSVGIFFSDNIQLIEGDVTDVIKEFEDLEFNHIIHDGGMPKTSGAFFSQSHAIQLFRKLQFGGRVHFYLPRKGISRGKDFALEQIRRMKSAGFRLKSRDVENSFCVFVKQ